MYKIWYRGEALLGYGYDNFKGNDTHNFFFFKYVLNFELSSKNLVQGRIFRTPCKQNTQTGSVNIPNRVVIISFNCLLY